MASIVLLTAIVCTKTADAQTSSSTPVVVSARLELTLPNNCGTQALFVSRVNVRSNLIRFSPQETNLVIYADITHQDNGLLQAKMTLRQPDGSVATRIIKASNCEQAIDGLALVTAVTLDPSSVTRTSEEPLTPLPSPVETAPPPPKPISVSKKSRQFAPMPTPVLTKQPELPSWGISVAGTALRGPAPGWMAGGEVAVKRAWFRDSVLSPTVRLGLSYQFRDNVAATGGVANFSLTSATLDLCPLKVDLGSVNIRNCGIVMGGVLTTKGRRTLKAETHHRPWSALGVGAEVNVLFSRQVTLPLRAFAVLPLAKDSYQFAPKAFYTTPSVTFGASAGITIQFR